jgi:hypothetical protein
MQTEHLKNRRVQIGLWVPELAAQNFRNPQQSTLIPHVHPERMRVSEGESPEF